MKDATLFKNENNVQSIVLNDQKIYIYTSTSTQHIGAQLSAMPSFF